MLGDLVTDFSPAAGVVVVDASVMVDALTMPSETTLRAALARHRLHAPALLDYEVLSAMRGLVRAGAINEVRAGKLLRITPTCRSGSPKPTPSNASGSGACGTT